MNKNEFTKDRSLPVNKKKKCFHNQITRSKDLFSDQRQVNEACSSVVHFELQVHKGLSVGCTSFLKASSGVVHIMCNP